MKRFVLLLGACLICLISVGQREDVVALNNGELLYGRIQSALLLNKESIKLKLENGEKQQIETNTIDFVINDGFQFFPRKFTNKRGKEYLDWLTLEIDGPVKLYSNIDNSILLDDGAVVCIKPTTRFFLEDDENGLQQFTESSNLVFNRDKVRDTLLEYFKEDDELVKRLKDPDYKFRLDDVRQMVFEFNHRYKMQRHQV